MGQYERLRADARALREEENEQFFICGNAADFEDTLEDDLQEFFESLEVYDQKAKEWQRQRNKLDAAVKKGDYATARVALEELYSLVF